MSQKPKAEAVPLPWAISTSISNFRVELVENGECLVRLDSFWGNHYAGRPYKRLAVTFQHLAGFYYGAAGSHSNKIGRDEIDWSGVFTQPQNEAELEAYLETYAANWSTTGVSSDSQFYLIHDSTWPQEYHDLLKHYLLSGCDAFLEILAADFTWEVLEDLAVE